MKKIVSLILAALLLFAFTAVAEQETEQETQPSRRNPRPTAGTSSARWPS